MIDWLLLGQAVEFYKERGYRYVETPWIVPAKVSRMTYAGEGFVCQAGTLVGSAEQGFLTMDVESGAKLVSCSPCFRPEPVVSDTHRLWFMKIELYVAASAVEMVLKDATDFLSRFVPISVEKTPEGFDIMSHGIELGSYGERRVDGHHWTYGTGLALPRLSIAVESLNLGVDKLPLSCISEHRMMDEDILHPVGVNQPRCSPEQQGSATRTQPL